MRRAAGRREQGFGERERAPVVLFALLSERDDRSRARDEPRRARRVVPGHGARDHAARPECDEPETWVEHRVGSLGIGGRARGAIEENAGPRRGDEAGEVVEGAREHDVADDRVALRTEQRENTLDEGHERPRGVRSPVVSS